MSALKVWRICYNGDLSLGALAYGSTLGPGRWHIPSPIGAPVVYTASSRALAQLEKRVHANGVAPVNQALISLTLPEKASIMDASKNLRLDPARWKQDEGYTQLLGCTWLKSKNSLALAVPSFVEPREMNFLLNPCHPNFTSIQVAVEEFEFTFDPRLL